MSRFGLGFVGGMNPGNDAFTKVLLHLDSNVVDTNAGGSPHTWTQHGGGFVAGEFGNAFSGSWIDAPDSADYTLGSSDFTVDFWFNVQGGSGALRYAFGQLNAAGTTQSITAALGTANKWLIIANSGTTFTGATAFTAAGWHHLAITRSGTTLRLFVDGVLDLTATLGAVTDSSDTFSVGRAGAWASNVWNGYIDEFRLSVGIARWTANFTPPTQQYG